MEDLKEWPLERLYVDYKPLLFSLAYHALGRSMDAEDVVQEVFLHLQHTPAGDVRNWKAYLCRAVHNRCMNRLQSSSQRHEVYTGPWLPEPIVTGELLTGSNPLERYMLKESLSTAFQLLLQQLTALERTVFVLREVLQFPFDDIAEITGKSSNYCRQIFYRARRSLGELPAGVTAGWPTEVRETSSEAESTAGVVGTGTAAVTKVKVAGTGAGSVAGSDEVGGRQQSASLVEPLLQALLAGNVEKLLGLLAGDAVLFTDGGGKVKAALRPIYGAERIARFFEGIRSDVPADFSFEPCEVNSRPGAIFRAGGYVFAALSIETDREGRIVDLFIVMNPDKLGHLNG